MSKVYHIVANNNGFMPHGAAREFWACKEHEVILSGAAETGKTRTALERLDLIAWRYPKSQLAIVRKVYKSMHGSVLQTYENKVANMSVIRRYGGEKVEFYEYPNGSRIWVGGMDNPDKVLSSERDIVYVNQAEELTLNDWEKLATRTTGRAGNMPYSQLCGDCNPAEATHWILERARNGKLKLFHSRHEDNPTLFANGVITEQGKRTLSILDNLTGVRHARLRLGQWVSVEGQIYTEYNPSLHLIAPFDIPADWQRFRSIDFGYKNPFVCLWFALDGDGRLYLYRQLYKTERTVRDHAIMINQLSEGERIAYTVCDHDSSDRATLAENGIRTQAANKTVSIGIDKVKERLRVFKDGKPRLFIFNNSLTEVDQNLLLADGKPAYCLEMEFGTYHWADNKRKEEPVKENDHALDALRYAIMSVDKRVRAVAGFMG